MALFGFSRRREHRFRQSLGRAESFGQFGSVESAVGFVFGPAGTGKVTAYDTLHVDAIRFSYQHCAIVPLRREVSERATPFEVRFIHHCDHVVVDDVADDVAEPER